MGKPLKVQTPLGIFDMLKDAVVAHRVSASTGLKRVRDGTWTMLSEPRSDVGQVRHDGYVEECKVAQIKRWEDARANGHSPHWWERYEAAENKPPHLRRCQAGNDHPIPYHLASDFYGYVSRTTCNDPECLLDMHRFRQGWKGDPLHVNADKTYHHWLRLADGKTEYCTRLQLCKWHRLDNRRISRILTPGAEKRRRVQVQGWVLNDPDTPILKTYERHVWENQSRALRFIGTRTQFMQQHGVKKDSLTRLMNGNITHSAGWRVAERNIGQILSVKVNEREMPL